VSLIWATRGRAWGFRFLRTAGVLDPLPVYEAAFAGVDDVPRVWRQNVDNVALRFPDPAGRRDRAGRLIPHDFVVLGLLSSKVRSVDDGILEVWPLVEERFLNVWDKDKAPGIDG